MFQVITKISLDKVFLFSTTKINEKSNKVERYFLVVPTQEHRQ